MSDFVCSSAKTERKRLREISTTAGAALLLVCMVQFVLALIGLQKPADIREDIWVSLFALLSGLSQLPGILLGHYLLKPLAVKIKRPALPAFPYAFFLVIAGAMLCFSANFVSSLVQQLGEQAGVKFEGGMDQVMPASVPSLLLMLLSIGLVPAVVEETLLRKVILPPLRRYGDGFAVVCTAVLFALLHQNMQQAPMAFVSGLALGWVYLRSGRLVISILVHFWNNAAAVLLLYLPHFLGEQAAARVSNRYMVALGILGLISCAAVFLLNQRQPAQEKPERLLSVGSRSINFFFGSIPMVLSLLYFFVIIAFNTKLV